MHAGTDIEYFHAAEDSQAIRDRVFALIGEHLPTLLIRRVLEAEELAQFSEVIVITDRLPLTKKKNAVKAAIKPALAELGVRYRLMHHDSKSNFLLQLANYVNWAISENGSAATFARTASLRPRSGAKRCCSAVRERSTIRDLAAVPQYKKPPGYSFERAPWALVTGEGRLDW